MTKQKYINTIDKHCRQHTDVQMKEKAIGQIVNRALTDSTISLHDYIDIFEYACAQLDKKG